MRFPTGKLPSRVLARWLARIPRDDPRLLVGPGIGLDAAVVALDDRRCLVAKTDPITFATAAIGWYAVQVCANDIATTGATPHWFMATILLPEAENNAALAETIFTQIGEACRELGLTLIGGHTEITYGLERPIVIGAMLGEVERERLVTAAGARPGDALILTKGIAIEGTAIIAREKPAVAQAVAPQVFERAQAFLLDPGISVVRDARMAVQAGRVHAMHDPTEGGLATALYEMAEAAGVGMLIEADQVPVFAETSQLCQATGLQAWGLIASGALLLAVEAADAQNIVRVLEREGIHAAVIGRVVEAVHGVQYRRPEQPYSPVPRFERDEIARLFE